jgi:hypothetical protein
MPAAAIGLLDTVTTTGTPLPVYINGEAMATGTTKSANLLIIPYEIVITCTGGTATVNIQTGNTIGGLATVGGAISLTAGKTWRCVGKLQTKYIALNVSAIAGATLNAYMRVHANQT